MNYQNIIKRLNKYSEGLVAYKIDADFASATKEAATAIEALLAENARLNRENFEQSLLVRNLEAERDAAVADIDSIAKGGRVWMCPFCKHMKNKSEIFADCDLNGACKAPFTGFEWRGAN